MQRYVLWCGYAGSSFEVKIETEIKTEADSNDITEYPHDGEPSASKFVVYDATFSTHISSHLTCLLFAFLILSHWAHFTAHRFLCLCILLRCIVLLHMCCIIVTWWGGPGKTEA